MAVKSRDSNDHLHTNVILGKITEYDIFMYYCPNFKEIGKKFNSDLREDKSPTVYITLYNGKLLYKDFGDSDHTFDCFNYVRYKYNCEFIDALRIVDCDFNLGLASNIAGQQFTMGIMGYRQANIPKLEKQEVIIRKKSRPWNKEDAKFWSKYLVSKKILTKFAVEPISHFWVNSDRFTCKSITYAFKFKNRYKIYSPYEDKNKWLSNTTKLDVQGFNQLPETGERLIITSSLKDVMCLHAAGYNAIAMQSEMQIPEKKLISELQERFKTIEILYDNGFNNICLPETFESKDPSDLVSKESSFNELKIILNDKR